MSKIDYENGRKDEAEITLENLKIILSEMTSEPHENDHILNCINDLEKYLGRRGKE